MATIETTRSEEAAQSAMRSISAMVDRFSHARECDGGEDCELTHQDIYEGLNLAFVDGDTATEEQVDEYHDEDQAREAIEEDALSVEVRSGWTTPGHEFEAEEYMILLSTGGPALRIVGELGPFNEPNSARLQHQDWFTPWIEYPTDTDEDAALIAYASHFLGF